MPGVDVRGVRRADEHRVRRLRRPARQIGGTKIGRVELGAGDLGDAVDAADAGGGRIPVRPSRQRLARCEIGLLEPIAKRDRLSAMPLAVTHFTNSRREGRMLFPLLISAPVYRSPILGCKLIITRKSYSRSPIAQCVAPFGSRNH